MKQILIILFIYFFIGAIAIIAINRKTSGKEKANIWVKYFVYLFLNLFMCLAIYLRFLYVISGIIIFLGGYEIINLHSLAIGQKVQIDYVKFLIAFIIYIIIGVLFFHFCYRANYIIQISLYTLVFCFDGFSQIIGQLIPSIKITPKISPNKTLAGVIGGFAAIFITSYILKNSILLYSNNIFLYSFVVGIFAFYGDLLASYYKRLMQSKDYSQLIPGHGGVLDRFDSFIMVGSIQGLMLLID